MNVRLPLLAPALALAVVAPWALAQGPREIREVVIPDLDSGRPGVLNLETADLAVPPESDEAKTEAELKELLAPRGDLVYDDAGGGLLFVVSGRTAALGRANAAELAGVDLRSRLRDVDRIEAADLAPASVLLLQSRAGGHALLYVIGPVPRGLRVRWIYQPEGSASFPRGAVEPLLRKEPMPLENQGREALLKPLGGEEPMGWHFASGGPVRLSANLSESASVEEIKAFGPLLAQHADLALSPGPLPTLYVGSGRSKVLGTVDAVPLEGVDLLPGMRANPYLPWTRIRPGALLLIQTREGGHALLRVAGLGPRGLEFSWSYRPEGGPVFSDLSFLDDARARGLVANRVELTRRLAIAVVGGQVDEARRLIGAGADPSAQLETTGQPLLVDAAIRGHAAIIALLLQSGADVNASGPDGWTPLHAAARMGHFEIVRELLERGADAERLTANGETALEVARSSNRQNPELIRFLQPLSGGPSSLRSAVRMGNAGAARRILEDTAEDLDQPDASGRTLLHLAAESGDARMVEVLLQGGADSRIEAGRDGAAIVQAARAGHLDVVRVLLEMDPDASATLAGEALYAATERGHANVVRVLLESGVDPMVSTGEAFTPQEAALRYGRPEVVAAYQEAGVELPLWAAARIGDTARIEELVRRGVNIDAAWSPDGQSALGLAVAEANQSSVEALVRQGANVNARVSTTGDVALHLAVARGSVELVAALLGEGADPNITNSNERTPLYEAVTLGRVDLAEELLRSGADPEIAPKHTSILAASSTDELRELLSRYGVR